MILELDEDFFETRESIQDGMRFMAKYLGVTLITEPNREDMSETAVQRIINSVCIAFSISVISDMSSLLFASFWKNENIPGLTNALLGSIFLSAPLRCWGKGLGQLGKCLWCQHNVYGVCDAVTWDVSRKDVADRVTLQPFAKYTHPGKGDTKHCKSALSIPLHAIQNASRLVGKPWQFYKQFFRQTQQPAWWFTGSSLFFCCAHLVEWQADDLQLIV